MRELLIKFIDSEKLLLLIILVLSVFALWAFLMFDI